MTKAADKNEIVTAKEACEILGGISVMTLRRRMDNKEITPLPKPPGLKRRHVLQFYRKDIEALLSS